MSPLPSDPYREYLLEARERWLRGQTVTAAQVREIYRTAARDTAREIARRLPTQPSAHHLNAIRGALLERSQDLSQELLSATLRGVELSTGAAMAGARAVAAASLSSAFTAGQIGVMYQAVNERAVLAFSTRRRFDGLRVSDRVWRIGADYRSQMGKVLESAIARGADSRAVARELEEFLHPGISSPHSPAVRARLGISSNVSHQGMRLARTEIANAYREGTVLGHRATPSYLGSRWEISGGHPFEDICDELAEGEDGFGFYAAGNEPFAPHPNCMCVLSPVHKDPDQFLRELQGWINDPSGSPELERWYANTARPLLEGKPIRLREPGRVVSPARMRAPAPRVLRGNTPVAQVLQEAATARTEMHAGQLATRAQDLADEVLESSRSPLQFRTADEVESWAQGRGIDLTDAVKREVDPEAFEDLGNAIEDVLARYGDDSIDVLMIDYQPAGAELGQWAGVRGKTGMRIDDYGPTTSSRIEFSGMKGKFRLSDTNPGVARSAYEGWIHELGHVMHNSTPWMRQIAGHGLKDAPMARSLIKQAMERAGYADTRGSVNRALVIDDVSQYATKNEQEFFCEVFTMYNRPRGLAEVGEEARARLEKFREAINEITGKRVL